MTATATTTPLPRARRRAGVPARVADPGRETRLLFAGLLVVYLLAAVALVLGLGITHGDALSRVGSTSTALHSGDPKLSAIGFVWGPLPALLMLPLVALRPVAPWLVETGFVASVLSAVSMAGAMAVLSSLLDGQGVLARWRRLLMACVALNPIILFYGANGMSEALGVLLLLVAARGMQRWAREGRSTGLASAGFALGLAYLTRYEAVAGGIAAVATVALLHAVRGNASWAQRRSAAVADAILVVLPVAAAVIVWSLTSWAIVGSPFEQFSSVYGNSAQLQRAREGSGGVEGPSASVVGLQIASLAPSLLLLVPLTLAWVIRHRERLERLAPAAVVGAVVTAQALGTLLGLTFDWLRFSMLAIPAAALLAGVALAADVRPSTGRHRPGVAAIAAVALFVVGMFTTAAAMRNNRLAPEEWQIVATILDPAYDGGQERERAGERALAELLDRRNLDEGAILVDNASAFGVVLASDAPRQFVVTSDEEFEAALADPAAFGVRYFVVPDPSIGPGGADAVNRAYPSLYADGAGIAELEEQVTGGPLTVEWRVYALNP